MFFALPFFCGDYFMLNANNECSVILFRDSTPNHGGAPQTGAILGALRNTSFHAFFDVPNGAIKRVKTLAVFTKSSKRAKSCQMPWIFKQR